MTLFKKSATRRISAAFALTLATGLGGAMIAHSTAAQVQKSEQKTLSAATPNSAVAHDQLSHAIALSETFKQITKAVSPSVVNIRSTEKIDMASAGSGEDEEEGANADPQQGPDDDFLRKFFEQQGQGGQLRRMPSQPREMVGEGTGVIARGDGYIVTNNHVVRGATEIRVKLDDDREYPATVIGTDPESDLAVIKIDASGLTPAKFGDSDKVEPGELVLAMGSPFGLQHTVTSGIVSAKGRSNMRLATFEEFIQTDAAINPGNSGGPLVNLYGEVVGINTAISTRSGGYEGIGFTIPSNQVSLVMNSIIDNGKVKRGWLGIEMHPLDKDLAASFGAKDANGVLIARVLPDGPAREAGLKKGDIIVGINSKPVSNPSQLLNSIGKLAPGQEATLAVMRSGKPREISVTLADRTEHGTIAAKQDGGNGKPKLHESARPSAALGLKLQNLNPQIARELQADADTQGAVVAAIDSESLAAKAGVQRGDIISAVGDTDVTSVEEAETAIKEGDLAKGIRLELITSGHTHFVIIKSEAH